MHCLHQYAAIGMKNSHSVSILPIERLLRKCNYEVQALAGRGSEQWFLMYTDIFLNTSKRVKQQSLLIHFSHPKLYLTIRKDFLSPWKETSLKLWWLGMATSWQPIFSRTDELVCNTASISKTKTEIMNIGTNPENEGNQQHLMRAERKTRMVFLSSAVPSTSSKDARAGGEVMAE